MTGRSPFPAWSRQSDLIARHARAHPLLGARREDRRPVAPHEHHNVQGRLESEA
jgi:hypothetical protein